MTVLGGENATFFGEDTSIFATCAKRVLKRNSLFEEEAEIFSEARGVVVADRLGVAEGFEERRRLEDLFGDQVAGTSVHRRQVLQGQLGALRLARTALSAENQPFVQEDTPPLLSSFLFELCFQRSSETKEVREQSEL